MKNIKELFHANNKWFDYPVANAEHRQYKVNNLNPLRFITKMAPSLMHIAMVIIITRFRLKSVTKQEKRMPNNAQKSVSETRLLKSLANWIRKP